MRELRKFRVYLDNCCFNLPDGEGAKPDVDPETKAKLNIKKRIAENDLNMVTSVVLEYENSGNPSSAKKKEIKNFFKLSKEYVDKREDVVSIAKEFNAKGIKPKDALNLACAVYADCDFFISTDEELLQFRDNRIRVISPADFSRIQADQGAPIVINESHDYIEWQKDLYKDMSVEDLLGAASDWKDTASQEM